MLDDVLNPLNAWCESMVRGIASFTADFFRDASAKLALSLSVNFWLLQGYRGNRLAIKKERLNDDILQGTLPIGIGASVAISFILLNFILT